MILIVDDNSDFVENCSTLLESYGYEVGTALSASEALEKISEHKPDLLISDCQMPDISGVQLSEQLRARAASERFPILLISSSLRNQVAPGTSYDAFLRKPFLAEALLLEVRKLLPTRPNTHN